MTGIYIKNIFLPITGDEGLKLSKKNFSVFSPGERSDDFSLTFKIAGTNESNRLFGGLFDVNLLMDTSGGQFDPGFNTNKKADAVIFSGGTAISYGYVQMTDLQASPDITYSLQFRGMTSDFFDKISALELTDLDFSDLDHTYSWANTETSWTASPGSGYYYPMIDYGHSNRYADWELQSFAPGIYVKEYLDRIFAAAGFSYSSTFLNSAFFKKLFIPFNQDKFSLETQDIVDRQFYTGNTTPQTFTFTTPPGTVDAIDKIIFDDDSSGNFYNTATTEWDVVTGVYTAAKTGVVALSGHFTAKAQYLGVPTVSSGSYSNKFHAIIYVVMKRGTDYYVKGTITITDLSFTGAINLYDFSSTSVLSFISPSVKVIAGDQLFLVFGAFQQSQTIRITPGGSTGSPGVTMIQYINTNLFSIILAADSTLALTVMDGGIYPGDTMTMNAVVPRSIKQTDFFGWIIKMFNLMIEPVSDQSTMLKIEPWATFYTSTAIDMSPYLVKENPIKITPSGALEGKQYLFAYKEDKDYENAKYKQLTGDTYGQRKKNISQDFKNEIVKIEVGFSPTPSASTQEINTNRVIPSIRFVDQNGEQKGGASNIRILYNGGLKDTETWHLLTDGTDVGTRTQYPYSGHLDDPFNPTLDLCFGPPLYIFWASIPSSPVINYKNNNLYSGYWRKFIEEITDRDSRILEADFAIPPDIYAKMRFDGVYQIDNGVYLLYEVNDYDIEGRGFAKCKFLRLKTSADFAPSTGVVTTGQGGFGDDTTIPKILTGGLPGGNSRQGIDGMIMGADNTSNQNYGAVMMGSGNVLGGNTGITAGDGNLSTSENSFILGGDQWELQQGGEAVINNLYMEKMAFITVLDIVDIYSNPLILLSPLYDGHYYEITRGWFEFTYGGTAFSPTTPKIQIMTDTTNTVLAETPSGVLGETGGLKGELRITSLPYQQSAGQSPDFGEGLTVTLDGVTSDGDSSELVLIVCYRIIRF